MPLFFLVVGIMLIVVGINDKLADLGALIKEDFSPANSDTPPFHYWIFAIVIAGSIGYYRPAKPLSTAFLVLIFIVIMLSNKGFVARFMQALKG